MYLLGYMTTAAVLLRDGVVIAAAEEEMLSNNQINQQLPIGAIQFCLQKAKIKIPDIDFICHNYNYSLCQNLFQKNKYTRAHYQTMLSPAAQISQLVAYWPELNWEKKFIAVPHHTAHAASVFYPSNYHEALILVVDKLAEVHSISIFHGKNRQIFPLHHYDSASSIGMLYALISKHLGFAGQENKVMALSAYGDPQRFEKFFSECVSLGDEGNIIIHGLSKNFNQWLPENTFPERKFDEPLKQQHEDLAAGLQDVLQKILQHILAYWQKKTGLKDLCYAGGVALNSFANGFIYRSGLFERMYMHPAVSGGGSAWGAALFHDSNYSKKTTINKQDSLFFFGPDSGMNKKLLDVRLNYQMLSAEKMLEKAVELLAIGKIIAWVQGSSEFGLRALGNRSILADARNTVVRNKLNRIVKRREFFCPFAASVKLEKAAIFFEMQEHEAFPYRMFSIPVRESYKNKLPAITHINGMAEVQTVDKSQHPYFWRLLDKFEERTGLPILLNSSFNRDKQPRIYSAKEAIENLTKMDLDAVFIDDYVFYKTETMTPLIESELLLELGSES